MIRWSTSIPCVLLLITALGWAMRERAFAVEQAKFLESKTVPLSELKLQDFVYEGTPRGEVGLYFNGQTATTRDFVVGIFRLKPGAEPHPIHTHSEEEILIVTSGTGEISCDGQTTRVGAGSVMYTRANAPHGIKNTGTEPLIFYFVKWNGARR
jgi:mannose-6-phosphate isomerase-like protein (cupin superfamily)